MKYKVIVNSLIKNKKLAFSLILVFSYFFIVGISKNTLENNLNKYHPDEYHTAYLAIQSLESGKVSNFRALEGSRWIYRLFYPGALINMSQKMGGQTVFSGWNRSGHNYILDNYIRKGSNHNRIREDIKADPNLRDFFYALRLQSILFVFICLIPLLYYCYKHENYWSLAFLIICLGLNYQLKLEQSYAYIEPILLGFISIILTFYLYIFNSKQVSYFIISVISFISAFSISVKFSSLFFIILLLSAIFLNKKNKFQIESSLKKILVIILSFGGSFIAINYYGFFGDFNKMLHDFVSNFWNYSSGGFPISGSEETAGGFNNFMRIVEDLVNLFGYGFYFLPVLLFFGFKYASKKERLLYGLILITTLFTLLSLIKQVTFLNRNLVPFYVPILFIIGILLTNILNQISIKKISHKNKSVPLIITVLILFIGYIPILVKYYEQIFPSKLANLEIAISDVSNLEKRKISYINMSDSDFTHFLNKKQNVTSDIYFSYKNYRNKIENFKEKLSKNDIVVVNRDKKNYHQYSNFLLPRYYDVSKQYGDYFVFYNDEIEIAKSDFKVLIKEPLSYESGLIINEISIQKLNNDCKLTIEFDEFINPKLFHNMSINFQGYPSAKNRSNLPKDRIQYGFENFGSQNISKLKKVFGNPQVSFTFTPALNEYDSFRFILLDRNRNKDDPYVYKVIKNIKI